jgi:hypothetical protein
VLRRAGKTVEFPHQDAIERVIARGLHECVELGAPLLPTGHRHLDYLQTALGLRQDWRAADLHTPSDGRLASSYQFEVGKSGP